MNQTVSVSAQLDIMELYVKILWIVLLGQAIKNVKTEHLLENLAAVDALVTKDLKEITVNFHHVKQVQVKKIAKMGGNQWEQQIIAFVIAQRNLQETIVKQLKSNAKL